MLHQYVNKQRVTDQQKQAVDQLQLPLTRIAAAASDTRSSHTRTRTNAALWGCMHLFQVSFSPPSRDVPDLHRAFSLPSRPDLLYLNVFRAAATAAHFWGWSFMSFAFKWKFMDQRDLIADPGSVLPPMKCFLWIWIWVLVGGPSKPMPHLQYTQTHNAHCLCIWDTQNWHSFCCFGSF